MIYEAPQKESSGIRTQNDHSGIEYGIGRINLYLIVAQLLERDAPFAPSTRN